MSCASHSLLRSPLSASIRKPGANIQEDTLTRIETLSKEVRAGNFEGSKQEEAHLRSFLEGFEIVSLSGDKPGMWWYFAEHQQAVNEVMTYAGMRMVSTLVKYPQLVVAFEESSNYLGVELTGHDTAESHLVTFGPETDREDNE